MYLNVPPQNTAIKQEPAENLLSHSPHSPRLTPSPNAISTTPTYHNLTPVFQNMTDGIDPQGFSLFPQFPLPTLQMNIGEQRNLLHQLQFTSNTTINEAGLPDDIATINPEAMNISGLLENQPNMSELSNFSSLLDYLPEPASPTFDVNPGMAGKPMNTINRGGIGAGAGVGVAPIDDLEENMSDSFTRQLNL